MEPVYGKWQPIECASVPLTRGKIAIIDAVDLPLVEGRSWQANRRRDGKGYYAVSDGLRMHRFLLGITDDRIVDHRDGDGLNNRRANLRAGTQALNCVNRLTTPGGCLRGARKKKKKWQAYIKQNGRQVSLGYYDTEIEAHQAYLEEARRRYGDWMPLPPPPAKDGRDA